MSAAECYGGTTLLTGETLMFSGNEFDMNSFALFAAAIMIGVSSSAVAQTVEPAYKAAPDTYKVIFEDNNFRVIEANHKKGVRDKMHSHPVPFVVYNLTDCKTRLYTPDGATKEVAGKAGTASANPVIAAHAAENIGDADCKQIFVEKK
jgi:hypothetical protein